MTSKFRDARGVRRRTRRSQVNSSGLSDLQAGITGAQDQSYHGETFPIEQSLANVI